MPSWSEDDPAQFWDAADLHERANGRLFVAADFALPCDLSFDTKVELAHEFAASLTDDECLPYTLAIHAGSGPDGEEHHPHVHLMFSERQNDGIERSPDRWFGRANSESPQDGGAPKSRTFHGRDWVEAARGRWAALVNDALERAGREDRVDHRSYDRQGVEREAGEHFGPGAASMLDRSGAHDRLERAATPGDTERELAAVEKEIAALESLRASLLREAEADERAYGSSAAGPNRDDDFSWPEVAMSSALETFRAQREAAEQVHAILKEVTDLLRGVSGQMQAIVGDDGFGSSSRRSRSGSSNQRSSCVKCAGFAIRAWRSSGRGCGADGR